MRQTRRRAGRAINSLRESRSRLAAPREPVRDPGRRPAPTSRSAQAAVAASHRDSSGTDDQDPLDHLPPLDLPGEVTRSTATPPVPPPASRNTKPDEITGKVSDASRESRAAVADDVDLTSTATPAVDPQPAERRAGDQTLRCRRSQAGRRQRLLDGRPEMARRKRLSDRSGPPKSLRGPPFVHHGSHQHGAPLPRAADQSQDDRSRTCRPV